jgi:hypothetical protein
LSISRWSSRQEANLWVSVDVSDAILSVQAILIFAENTLSIVPKNNRQIVEIKVQSIPLTGFCLDKCVYVYVFLSSNGTYS